MNQRVPRLSQHVEAERALSWLKESGSTAYIESIDEGVGSWLSNVGAGAATGALGGLAGGPLGVLGGAVLGALGAAAGPGQQHPPSISPSTPVSPPTTATTPSTQPATTTPASASSPTPAPAAASSSNNPTPVAGGASNEPKPSSLPVSQQSLQELAQQLLPILKQLLSQQSQPTSAGSTRESFESDNWSHDSGDLVPDEAFLRAANAAGLQEDVYVRDHRRGAQGYETPVIRDHRTVTSSNYAPPSSNFVWNASAGAWTRPQNTAVFTPATTQPPVSYPTPSYPSPPTPPQPFPGTYGAPTIPWPTTYPPPAYSPWPGGYPPYQPQFVQDFPPVVMDPFYAEPLEDPLNDIESQESSSTQVESMRGNRGATLLGWIRGAESTPDCSADWVNKRSEWLAEGMAFKWE
jgi:hypothetical protein